MNLKNYWTLVNYNDKDVNMAIIGIRPQPHDSEIYRQLLLKKVELQRSLKEVSFEQITSVLYGQVKKVPNKNKSTICPCCFYEMYTNRHRCYLCGYYTCKKCLVRNRKLKDGYIAQCCYKCYNYYLETLASLLHWNAFNLLEKAFIKLVEEQEFLENLVLTERSKMMNGATEGNALIAKASLLARLKEENKYMKNNNLELAKKINFGKAINRDLTKRLRKARKLQKYSFGSASNHDDYTHDVYAPRAEIDLNLSVYNINESLLTSMLYDENDFSIVAPTNKCKCSIY